MYLQIESDNAGIRSDLVEGPSIALWREEQMDAPDAASCVLGDVLARSRLLVVQRPDHTNCVFLKFLPIRIS